jgi:queuosine precursor transporter
MNESGNTEFDQHAAIKQKGYKYLVIFSMFYMSIMLFNAIMTNRYIGNEILFVLGGTFTSPLIFILDDIIAEIYGYKTARSVIIYGFVAQLLFAIVSIAVIAAPHPAFFDKNNHYASMLGYSLFHITVSGFFAYIIANLINSYIITRWKVLLKGRMFWLRSIGSSAFSEILYSFIAILAMQFGSIPLNEIIKVALLSCTIKLVYSVVLAFPANLLTNHVKKVTGIDVYDIPRKFTPFASFVKRA